MLPEDIIKAEQNQVEEIQRRVRRSAAFQRLFRNNPDGEIFLQEIKTFCKANTLIIHSCSTETQIIADTAKKDVWQFIKNCMDVDIDKTEKMLKEFQNASNKTA